jgi:hypothetical protein
MDGHDSLLLVDEGLRLNWLVVKSPRVGKRILSDYLIRKNDLASRMFLARTRLHPTPDVHITRNPRLRKQADTSFGSTSYDSYEKKCILPHLMCSISSMERTGVFSTLLRHPCPPSFIYSHLACRILALKWPAPREPSSERWLTNCRDSSHICGSCLDRL